MKHVDLITCNNVLNVLDDESLNIIINELKSLSEAYKIPVYITVYGGDKTGHGKMIRNDCYQRNDKEELYIEYLKDFFATVTVKNGIIICKY